ncbi:MAG: SRPBCC domain-containing protein [Cyanobacteria bacterium REEB459]|nr:SRPBCC domain-containing protein [Cyanobacteria bacterium REEB459]
MASLYSQITIEAPRSTVWEALIRKEEWYRWNTFLYDCDASRPMRQGQDIALALRRLEAEAQTEFQPRLVVVQPNHCLQWIYRGPGFSSEHWFELQEVGPNRTRYGHQERLSGWLARLVLPAIRREEKIGMERMGYQLKRYVERTYPGQG